MKILVTGASGGVGSAVARELLDNNHQVRIFDRAAPSSELRRDCEVVYGDVTDRLAVLRAVQDCEAVAHLAAIPNPMGGNALELFAPNVLGTQHLLSAAEGEGIQRFVLASSGSIYGFPFQPENAPDGRIEPQYLPLDEEHPILNRDVYALSKQCNELCAAMMTRRTGMATTCLRLSWVVDFTNVHQKRWAKRGLSRASEWKNPDLWTYVERRDAARAFRLSLENVDSGHHVLLIAARDVWGAGDRKEWIRKHYPQLESYLENGFPYETDGFWNTRRAEDVLGWKSEIHWRDVPEWNEEK